MEQVSKYPVGSTVIRASRDESRKCISQISLYVRMKEWTLVYLHAYMYMCVLCLTDREKEESVLSYLEQTKIIWTK